MYRILLLRPESGNSPELEPLGIVYNLPVIDIVPRQEAIDEIEFLLNWCDWLVITSPRAPRLLASIRSSIVEAVRARGVKIAVVGPKTLLEARRYGIPVHLIPKEYRGEALARELLEQNPRPRRVLLARSEQAVQDLPRILREAGVEVRDVPLYRVTLNHLTATIAAIMAYLNADAVVYTSPTIVRAMAEAYKMLGINPAKTRAIHVAIGPTTAKEAKRLLGIDVPYPKEYTLRGVAELLKQLLGSRNRNTGR